MVACSPAGTVAVVELPVAGLRVPSKVVGAEDGGVGRAGSGVEGEVDPVWFGFHMIRLFPFLFACMCRAVLSPGWAGAQVNASFSRNVQAVSQLPQPVNDCERSFC